MGYDILKRYKEKSSCNRLLGEGGGENVTGYGALKIYKEKSSCNGLLGEGGGGG